MVASPVSFPIKTVNLSPGSHLLIQDVAWEQYEALLEELGSDRIIPRINYCDRVLELMSPLPSHERPHRIIADIVKVLLDASDRDWEDFGSTTLRKPQKAGVEADTCLYIENAARVRNLLRIDLDIDPPPDLAIESDVTSKTTLEAYEAIAVPEVWIYENNKLRIYILRSDGYQLSQKSAIFPDFEILEMIPRLIQQAYREGTSQMLRQLRKNAIATS
ncbi:MAG: Uma2 family endonuclease [Cyanobacteria bacterium SBLK]|nr:Uma2 family endonuclease [Cyanobacteria bacterium SBLK]